jgi:hypothetical protein
MNSSVTENDLDTALVYLEYFAAFSDPDSSLIGQGDRQDVYTVANRDKLQDALRVAKP